MNQLPRTYRWLDARCGWLHPKIRVVWRACWLGLLKPEELNELTFHSYLADSGFGDPEHNLPDEGWPSESHTFALLQERCRSVLVAGAGGGREAIALARRGMHVSAFDFSPAMTEACRRNLATAGLRAVVLEAAADSVPPQASPVDGILLGRGFYHHLPTRDRRVRFLRRCRELVPADAPIVFSDFFIRDEPSRLFGIIHAVGNTARTLRWGRPRVERGDWLAVAMQHAFLRTELETELEEAGFVLETFEKCAGGADVKMAYAVGRSIRSPFDAHRGPPHGADDPAH